MKKTYLFLLAASAIALGACSDDKEEPWNPVIPGTDVTLQSPTVDVPSIDAPELDKLMTDALGYQAIYKNGQTITYSLVASDGTVPQHFKVVAIEGDAKDVIIPSSVPVTYTSGIQTNIPVMGFSLTSTREFSQTVESLTFPSSITLSDDVFTDQLPGLTNLQNVYIQEDASKPYSYCSIDGAVYTVDRTTLVSVPTARKGEFVVADGTLYIGKKAFNKVYNVNRVVIPASVIGIGEDAFLDNNSLAAIDILATEAPAAPERAFGVYARRAVLRIPTGSLANYMVSKPTIAAPVPPVQPIEPTMPEKPGENATDAEKAAYDKAMEAFNAAMEQYDKLYGDYVEAKTKYDEDRAAYDEAWDQYNTFAGYQFFPRVEQVTFTIK